MTRGPTGHASPSCDRAAIFTQERPSAPGVGFTGAMTRSGTARRGRRASHVLAALSVAVPLLLVAPAQPACACCGLEGMEAGKDYLVMAETSGATMPASLCGGTTRLTPERLAAVEKVTGPGSTPSPAPAGTARQPAWRIPVLPLGLAVAVIAGVLLAWRSRRR